MLTAGPETDLAVAKACGIPVHYSIMGGVGYRVLYCYKWQPVGSEERRPFQPSTDLNDAFAAAEKFGLFDTSGFRFLSRDSIDKSPVWIFWEHEIGFVSNRVVLSCEETPAIAICSAILKLAEKK